MVNVVYLDHHVLVDREAWPVLKAWSDEGRLRVAISTWTIREIAQGRDERVERMAFLESFPLLYVHDMLVLQRLETVSFLNDHLFGAGAAPFAMSTERFSDFLQMNFNIRARADYTLSDYIRAEGDLAGDVVEEGKLRHMEAMAALIAQSTAVLAVEDRTNLIQMLGLIPRRRSSGRPWEPSEIADMLVFCQEHRRELLRRCPAVLAESELSRARLRDVSRRPRASDTADLFHGVSALAYADAFVTNDGWAGDRAREAGREMHKRGVRSATIMRTLAELSSWLDASVAN